MKKFLVLLSFALFAATGYSQLIKVTAIQRAGYPIDTTDFYLNPKYIQYIKGGTNPLVTYVNVPNSDTAIIYKATQNFDTIINQANRASANVIKLMNVTTVTGTVRDTAITWAYPINKFVEVKAKTDAARPKTHATVGAKQDNKAGYQRWDIYETPVIIKTRVDSLIRIAKNLTF